MKKCQKFTFWHLPPCSKIPFKHVSKVFPYIVRPISLGDCNMICYSLHLVAGTDSADLARHIFAVKVIYILGHNSFNHIFLSIKMIHPPGHIVQFWHVSLVRQFHEIYFWQFWITSSDKWDDQSKYLTRTSKSNDFEKGKKQF